MMRVEVRLYGSLRRYRPSEVAGLPHLPFAVALPLGASVDDLGRQLGLSQPATWRRIRRLTESGVLAGREPWRPRPDLQPVPIEPNKEAA